MILKPAPPSKFPEEIAKNLGFTPDVPPQMVAAEKLPEAYDRMGAEYSTFKTYLMQTHSSR